MQNLTNVGPLLTFFQENCFNHKMEDRVKASQKEIAQREKKDKIIVNVWKVTCCTTLAVGLFTGAGLLFGGFQSSLFPSLGATFFAGLLLLIAVIPFVGMLNETSLSTLKNNLNPPDANLIALLHEQFQISLALNSSPKEKESLLSLQQQQWDQYDNTLVSKMLEKTKEYNKQQASLLNDNQQVTIAPSSVKEEACWEDGLLSQQFLNEKEKA